jgi:glutamate-ammonia-ligase adenylyltransferase
MADQLARLGISPALRLPLAAAGWIAGEAPAASATPLLAEVRRGPDPEAALVRLVTILESAPEIGRRALGDPDLAAALVAVVGASPALSRLAATDPAALARAAGALPAPVPIFLPDPGGRPDRMRTIRSEVGRRLLAVAVRDLTGRMTMPQVGLALSEVADSAAGAALAAARSEVATSEKAVPPFCVVAVGKWGGRELNYASDIDVLFVYDLLPGADDEAAAAAARQLAESFLEHLGSRTADGIAFRVDARLRPEGKAGPLARTLASYRAYWEKWAETWELQALIKARVAAGDAALGAAFLAAAEPFIYPETLGADAVREVRMLKGRSEAEAASRGTVEIKRGEGGIRDIEFAVQLLQLVHGRSDPGLRSSNTLEALRALAEAGYVRPDDSATLEDAYCWLRDVEHRLQLVELRRTHELPADPGQREAIAKACGYRDGLAATALERFDADLVERRATVRSIHERLFYRPLLEAFAASPVVRLTSEGIARQLAALGFADVEGARRAFDDLTAGLSRRSRLMQQLLPLMMEWLSETPDPDLGLAQLRLLVTSTPDNAELISAMRDNPVAAERLCTLLGTSRLLGRLIDRVPAALTRLGNDEALADFPSRDTLAAEAGRRLALRPQWPEAATSLRRFVDAHLLWIAGMDLVGGADESAVALHLTDLADAVTEAALAAAISRVAAEGPPPPPMAVIAMGKWGGVELNYASDIDGLIVYRATGVDDEASRAARVAEMLLRALSSGDEPGPGLTLDLDLRPEGRAGAPARSLESYTTYWDRWAETWELQSLLRARFTAGEAGLGAEFVAEAAARVFQPSFSADREVRQMKARLEQERIPPQEDPQFHMKLGRGGMADVEWAVQLLQLRHGHQEPGVRGAATLEALDALEAAGLLAKGDAAALRSAYRFCARVRNRLFLQAGRPRDSLPTDPAEATRVARSLGYTHNPRTALREEYRKVTRRGRRAFEKVFFGNGER